MRRMDGLAMALLVALSALFFAPLLVLDAPLFGLDLWQQFRPMSEFAFQRFRQGELPLWNPFLFLGFPQYAEPQLATFYPPLWAAAWLPSRHALTALVALHLAVTATGGYALVRALGGRPAGALLAGFALAFGGFSMAHLYAGHLAAGMTMAWLAWLLVAARWALRRGGAATVLAGVPLALAILAGSASFLPYLGVALATLVSVAAAGALRRGDLWEAGRALLRGAAIVGAGALLAAVQLVPTLEFAQRSSRVAAANYEFASSYALPWWALPTLAMPGLYGAPAGRVLYWASPDISFFLEATLHAGVLPLLFWGLAARGGSVGGGWFVVGLAGLWVALGPAGALHRLLYEWVPGFGLFRAPARFGYFWGLAAAVLMGLNFDRWFEASVSLRERQTRELALTAAVLVGAAVILVGAALAFNGALRQAALAEPLAAWRVQNMAWELGRLVVLLAAALALLRWGHRWPRLRVATLALALLLADLWGSGLPLVTPDDPAQTEAHWVAAAARLPANRAEFRVMMPQSDGASLRYGFLNVAGNDGFRLQTSVQMEETAFQDARVARLLSARFLLDPFHEADPTPGWTPQAAAPFPVYELPRPQPRAFVVHEIVRAASDAESLALLQNPTFDPTRAAIVTGLPDGVYPVSPAAAPSRVEVRRYMPERVVLQASTAAPGWLVLGDLFYPGWQATVGGEPTPIFPTDYALRGLWLPAGTHDIVFEFRPRPLIVGAAGSAIGLALLAGALVRLGRLRVGTRRNGRELWEL